VNSKIHDLLSLTTKLSLLQGRDARLGSLLPSRNSEGFMRGSHLTEYAKTNQRSMTEPEKRLWQELRAKRFLGISFWPQKVIGNYIVDFAANDPKIIIEIDGDNHSH
jgi:hypothetical protein